MPIRSVVTMVVIGSGDRRSLMAASPQATEHGVGVGDPAIALDRVEAGVVPFGGVSGAGVGDQRDQVATVGGIAHGHVDALIGDDAGNDQVAGFRLRST